MIIAGIEDNMAQKLSAKTLLASITYTLLENGKGRVNIKNKTIFSYPSLPSYSLITKGAISAGSFEAFSGKMCPSPTGRYAFLI